jgi:hypothetical protein
MFSGDIRFKFAVLAAHSSYFREHPGQYKIDHGQVHVAAPDSSLSQVIGQLQMIEIKLIYIRYVESNTALGVQTGQPVKYMHVT